MRALALALALAACSSNKPRAPDDHSCDDAPGWRCERIELPPEFAPALPPGVEILYFAPGMFEPAAADYWSYVFSLGFERPLPADPQQIQALLETYYRGLISAVSRGKKREVPDPAAAVMVETTPTGYLATVRTHDAFSGGQPITVTLDIRVAGTCMNVAASAAAPGAPVWRALDRARRCVSCP